MGMYYREGGMVMTTNRKSGYFPDRSNVDNCLRASPEPDRFIRCPASTPLQTHRPLRQRIPESLTFVSLDFSKVKSFPKVPPHRGPKGFRAFQNRNARSENIARKKNFDYYYVDKAFQNRLAAYSNSSWLRSLVSQPVPEIFNKYRRHGEMMDEPLQVPRSYSTPGERAILDGWDSNSRYGHREKSAYSLSPKTALSSADSNSPHLTVISRSCTTAPITLSTGNGGRNEKRRNLPTPNQEEHSEPSELKESIPSPDPTPRASPIKREQISEIRLPTGFSPLIDESIYANFERKDMKLPDINASKSTATQSTSKPRKIFFDGNSENGQQMIKTDSPRGGNTKPTTKKQQTSSLNNISENIYNF